MQSNYEPIPHNKSLTVIPQEQPKVVPTIKAPKAILKAWLTALRSGIFKQGRGRLLTEEGGLCCLGVLQAVTDGDVERYTNKGDNGKPRALPTREWLESKGITFAGRHMRDVIPFLPTIGLEASAANDGNIQYGGTQRSYSFAEIADAIEACSVGY